MSIKPKSVIKELFTPFVSISNFHKQKPPILTVEEARAQSWSSNGGRLVSGGGEEKPRDLSFQSVCGRWAWSSSSRVASSL